MTTTESNTTNNRNNDDKGNDKVNDKVTEKATRKDDGTQALESGFSEWRTTTTTNATTKHYDGKSIRPEDWPWIWAIQDEEALNWRNQVKEKFPDEEEYEQEVKRILLQQRNLPVPLLEELYISDAFTVAVETQRLRDELGITHVLNMGGYDAQFFSRRNAHFENLGMVYKMVDAVDTDDYPLMDYHWEECRNFIDQALEADSNNKVLVHCAAGINRSGLIATAYYMMQRRVGVLEAVHHCRKCRGTLLWNQSFQRQLVALAREEGLLGPPPGSEECTLVKANPPPLEKEAQREASKRIFRGW